MYQTLLCDANLYKMLVRVDDDLVASVRSDGCKCGSKLHSARYRRKARGIPRGAEDLFETRASFCCSREGCRRRTTPPSVRFLGRKVFVAAVVVLATVLRHGATPVRLARIRELTGASPRTVERWRTWWKEDFAHSRFWRGARARLRRPVENRSLPVSLLECFTHTDPKAALAALLRFISPVSTSGPAHAF